MDVNEVARRLCGASHLRICAPGDRDVALPSEVIDVTAATHLATAELARATASASMPVAIDVECCAETDVMFAPVGSSIVWRMPTAVELGLGYRLDLVHTPHILSHPDPDAVRRTAQLAVVEAPIALDIARASFDRSHRSSLTYTTWIRRAQVTAPGPEFGRYLDHQWIVQFAASPKQGSDGNVDSDDIEVDVNVKTSFARTCSRAAGTRRLAWTNRHATHLALSRIIPIACASQIEPEPEPRPKPEPDLLLVGKRSRRNTTLTGLGLGLDGNQIDSDQLRLSDRHWD